MHCLILIFSKNRALQLDAAMRSFLVHCRDADRTHIRVCYKTTGALHRSHYARLQTEYARFRNIAFIREQDFHSDIIALMAPFDHVVFLVDDTIFVRDFRLSEIIEMIDSHSNAMGFSLRVGTNTTYCYPLDKEQRLPEFQSVGSNMLKYDWTRAEYDFGYPLEVSSSVYRTEDILPFIAGLPFKNPNTLESLMAGDVSLFRQSRPFLLCFEQSVTFCAPFNKVQSVYAANRTAGDAKYSVDSLAGRFDDGYRIDIAAYQNLLPNACHQEVDLKLAGPVTPVRDPQPLVSVVIPCYNQAGFLPEAVESVIRQTYWNWECIIVNDGSPDSTREVAKELIAKHPDKKIILLEKENGGLADARNCGINAAHGTYILPLDADDKLTEKAVEALLKTCRKHTCPCIAFGSYRTFGEKEELIVSLDHYSPKKHRYSNMLAYCSLYPKTVWTAANGYSADMKEGYEDWDFWLSCQSHGFAFHGTREVVLLYRIRKSSMLSEADRKRQSLRARIVCHHPDLFPKNLVTSSRKLMESEGIGKSILMISQYSHHTGGTETLARDFTGGFMKKGHKARLLYINVRESAPLSENETIMHDFPTHYADDFGHAARIVEDIAPEVILLLTDMTHGVVHFIAQFDFCKKIVHINLNNQGYDFLKQNPQRSDSVCKALRNYDAVVTLFPESKAALFLQEHGMSFEVIQNGVPEIQPGDASFRQRFNLPSDTHLLIYPGLIAPMKNQIGLLKEMHDIHSKVTIVFMGSLYEGTPEYSEQFLQRIAARPDCFFLTGLSRDDVAQAMREASLCLFPSLSEGAPLTLIESMSHGLVWITTPNVIFAHRLKGGIICPVSEFPGQIDQLLGDPVLRRRMGAMGKHHFQKHYRIEHTVESFERLIETLPPPTEEPRDLIPRSVLWVRTDAIGDAVLASSMLPFIREKYRHAKITVFCQEQTEELYASCPFVDDTITFQSARVYQDENYRNGVLKKMQTLHADVALVPVYSREPLTDFFARGSNAKERIAFIGDLSNMDAETRDRNNHYYTLLLSGDGEYKPELERHRDFLKGIGIEVSRLEPVVWLTPEDEQFADEFFQKNNVRPKQTIALFAGVQNNIRLYEQYGAAIAQICKENQFTVIALGAADDRSVNQRNLDAIGVRTLNVSGTTTLRQAAAIIKRCRLAVGSETSMAHIACAVGTPNVILMGGGHFGRFMPYSPLSSLVCLPLECYHCGWRCEFERVHCVMDILPEVFTEAVRQTLDHKSANPRVFVQGESLRDPQPGLPSWRWFSKFLDSTAVEIIPVGNVPAISCSCSAPDEHILPAAELQTLLEQPGLAESAVVSLKQADGEFQQGNLSSARDRLQQILSTMPSNIRVIIAYGNVLFRLGTIESARREFLKAMILDRSYTLETLPVVTLKDLAAFYKENGYPDTSLLIYKKVSEKSGR
jgi:ADP-heptose:LPS heptosyltransferase/glycosyltransferase involved in cell wall biosynthesis